jgi:hypothetical protein
MQAPSLFQGVDPLHYDMPGEAYEIPIGNRQQLLKNLGYAHWHHLLD